MAPVVRALRKNPEQFQVRICVTAQHRDLLDPLLRYFDLCPDRDLDVMRDNQSLAGLTASLFGALGPLMHEERPDWVLVQGDTTSAMVASLTARYAGAMVAHIEAGLRSGRMDEPFPEELNRLLIGRVADLHFAPTDRALANLLAEGIDRSRVVVTGNPGIDALEWTLAQSPALPATLADLAGRRVVFVTLHRRESFGLAFDGMCEAVATLALQSGDDVCFVCTVHPNPHASEPIRRILDGRPGVRLIDPLSYPQTVALLERCTFVMTDSGGLQEEAPALGKPVLVMREVTERPEGVDAGVAALVGRDPGRIMAAARALLQDPETHARMARVVKPYGDGRAAERIAAALACERPAGAHSESVAFQPSDRPAG